MNTTVFSSGNVSLALNAENEFDYVDIHGPVYILGGEEDSFLGVSKIECSNLLAYGDIECETLNGEKPITSGNIDNYLGDVPDIVITRHAESANGGYYYSTNSTEAGNYDKSIPTMQWVMNYVDEILNS